MLPSIGNEIVKAVVAQYNAEQLLTQRDKVSKAVGTPNTRHWGLCSPLQPPLLVAAHQCIGGVTAAV